jgi:Xaa-Pro aminopeptidase
MPNVLIFADTLRSPDLRHELPVAIGDPFIYAEANGSRHVVISEPEFALLAELGLDLELHPPEKFGSDERAQEGLDREEIQRTVAIRFCKDFGIHEAIVPDFFPVRIADALRNAGVALLPQQKFFSRRRRAKTPSELAGVRRAQTAAQSAMAVAADMIRRAEPHADVAILDGEPLTCEGLKDVLRATCFEHDTSADQLIVAHGPQTARGHDTGSGLIRPSEPIVIDLWPRDNTSACFADMTRTFVVGDPPETLVEWHRVTKDALDASLAAIRAGALGRDVYDVACEIIEAAGHVTQRTKTAGTALVDGFYHGLGHGVGLELHEAPGMGLADKHELVAGDVVSVEPGIYRQRLGGVRLEDLVLVTESGAENLTNFPYDLTP